MKHATLLVALLVAGLPLQAQQDATPESQGVDSAALAELVGRARGSIPGLHSLLLVRHGKVVLDAYFYPFAPGLPHDAASVTKSITSIATGIAVDRGLEKLDEKVLPIFPREGPAEVDARKAAITIDDLLTMRPGLDCGFRPGEQELAEMRRSPDWVQAALALHMKYDPGTHFGYCSPGFHLLSSILMAKTGMSEFAFARRYLFEALGIKKVIWPVDPQGRTHGWGNSHLLPRDFAKLGLLYLHGGAWEGKQVVSGDWVKRSVAVHTQARAGVDYGYGWWLYNEANPKYFEANGRGGQRVIVAPSRDLVLVLTGGGYDTNAVVPAVFAAVKGEEALPENAGAARRLREKVDAAIQPPAAGAVSAVPAVAVGKTYVLDPLNATRLESLAFSAGELRFKMMGEEYAVPLGLDGVYRLAATGPFNLPMGAKFAREGDGEYLLDLNLIANINHYELRMRFVGDRVEIVANEASGLAKDLKLVGMARR
jgi:CubicO group peptidase (beta-lactamase class C family)